METIWKAAGKQSGAPIPYTSVALKDNAIEL